MNIFLPDTVRHGLSVDLDRRSVHRLQVLHVLCQRSNLPVLEFLLARLCSASVPPECVENELWPSWSCDSNSRSMFSCHLEDVEREIRRHLELSPPRLYSIDWSWFAFLGFHVEELECDRVDFPKLRCRSNAVEHYGSKPWLLPHFSRNRKDCPSTLVREKKRILLETRLTFDPLDCISPIVHWETASHRTVDPYS